jgi:hypothetical protein
MGFKTGVFGSPPERVQWRLIRVMISMWIIMIFNGVILNHFFGTPLWTLPELYLVGLIAFHSWHWASHQRWLLYPMWKLHMYHHLVVYPQSHFFLASTKMMKAAGQSSIPWLTMVHHTYECGIAVSSGFVPSSGCYRQSVGLWVCQFIWNMAASGVSHTRPLDGTIPIFS